MISAFHPATRPGPTLSRAAQFHDPPGFGVRIQSADPEGIFSFKRQQLAVRHDAGRALIEERGKLTQRGAAASGYHQRCLPGPSSSAA